VFGLKPTRGRNPQGPDRGEGWSGMSTEHVVSRSVRDSAALLDLTCGPDRGAPYFAPPPARPYLAELDMPVGALRIGLALRTPGGEAVDPECERAARDAARLCESLGHRVDEVRLDGIPEEFGAAFRVVIAGNVRVAVELHAAKIGRQPQAGDLEGVTAAMFDAGAKASAADYARAVLIIHKTGRAVARWFDTVDVLLSPTLTEPPRKLGVFDMNTDDFDLYGRHVARFTAFTSCYNASGNPAMSVPLHWAADGLPIGVQFAGRYGDEATLLRLAVQLEQARPWAGRRPALS
jgi:amidase/6-aminohexanoate-cyclic-dimer hydrolase